MNTSTQIVYWRDIPAQVKARAGGTRLAKPLTDRFQQAIDEAAMRAGLTGTDDYLQEWRTGEATDHDGEPAVVVDMLAAELEAAYPPDRLRKLVAAAGRE